MRNYVLLAKSEGGRSRNWPKSFALVSQQCAAGSVGAVRHHLPIEGPFVCFFRWPLKSWVLFRIRKIVHRTNRGTRTKSRAMCKRLWQCKKLLHQERGAALGMMRT